MTKSQISEMKQLAARMMELAEMMDHEQGEAQSQTGQAQENAGLLDLFVGGIKILVDLGVLLPQILAHLEALNGLTRKTLTARLA